jgi:6-methylsalicylate decarboxylase
LSPSKQEHHLLTSGYLTSMNGAGLKDVGGFPIPDWRLEAAMEIMGACGITASILSISAPAIDFLSRVAAQRLARSVNEEQAAIIQRYPTRFGALAILPLPDVDAALAELDHALGSLALDGVVLFSNIQGIYLGDPRFAPLFDELERRPRQYSCIRCHRQGLTLMCSATQRRPLSSCSTARAWSWV